METNWIGSVLPIIIIAAIVLLFARRIRRARRLRPKKSRATGKRLSPWQLICFALAVPIVYTFEQYFFEAVTAFFYGTKWLALAPFRVPVSNLFPETDSVILALLVFAIAVVIFVLGVIMLVIALVVTAITIPPGFIAYWLATHPGPPRYVLDIGLVWYVGMFLYGVMFPLLWQAIAPLIALTLGELAFQRAKLRVYGERPRYSQPFYLIIAISGLLIGGARLIAPVAGTASGVSHK